MPSALTIVITDGVTPINLKPRQVGENSVFEDDAATFLARKSLVTSNRLATNKAPQKTRMSLKEPVVGTVDGEEQVLRLAQGSTELLVDANATAVERGLLWDHHQSMFDDTTLRAQFVDGEKFFG